MKQFQVWRLLTALGFHGTIGGPGTLMTVFNIVFAFMWLSRLESGEFKGKKAAFIWFIFLAGGFLELVSIFLLPLPFLGAGLSMAMVWVWTRYNYTQTLSIFGYVDVSAHWFPWIACGLHFIFGQDWLQDICGIAAGHTYYFLREILPQLHNISLVQTPKFLEAYFPPEQQIGGFQAHIPIARHAAQPAPPPPGQHRWGSGRVLGAMDGPRG